MELEKQLLILTPAEKKADIEKLIDDTEKYKNGVVTRLIPALREQGRGFAVVAEEVRKLAEQSEGAAKLIATLIGEIQSETEQAVLSMHNGTEEVQDVAAQTQIVSAATEQQTALMQEIAATSRSLTYMAEELQDAVRKFTV